MKYKFPQDLYTEVRIEDTKNACYSMQNDDVLANSETLIKGAMIRVFDGNLWYTAQTNDTDTKSIQKKIDELAAIAKPNKAILENPIVKNFSVNKAEILKFQGKNSLRNLTKKDREDIVKHYRKKCIDKSIPEIKVTYPTFITFRKSKSFIPAKVQSSNRIISAVVLVSGMKLPAAKELPTAEVNSSGALISMN